MKLKCALAGAIGLATLAAAGQAVAAPMTHDGFYLSMEAGFGYLSMSAESQGYESSWSSPTFSSGLLLGGTVGPVVIGGGFLYDNGFSPSVEINGEEGEVEDLNLYLISLGAFVDVYLDPAAGGLHFLGFVGWGGLEASYQGDTSGSDPTGILFTLGVGYDFWIADEWSVGPLGRFTYAPLSYNDVDFPTTQFAAVADFKFH